MAWMMARLVYAMGDDLFAELQKRLRRRARNVAARKQASLRRERLKPTALPNAMTLQRPVELVQVRLAVAESRSALGVLDILRND